MKDNSGEGFATSVAGDVRFTQFVHCLLTPEDAFRHAARQAITNGWIAGKIHETALQLRNVRELFEQELAKTMQQGDVR